jgi:hypothetical protein
MSEYFPGLSSPISLYVVGVFASFALEIAALLRATAANSGQIPEMYRSRSLILVRTVFALAAAGPMAAIISNGSALIAFFVGASSPLFFDRIAAGVLHVGVETERAKELQARVSRAEEEIKEKPHEPKPIWELAKAQL